MDKKLTDILHSMVEAQTFDTNGGHFIADALLLDLVQWLQDHLDHRIGRDVYKAVDEVVAAYTKVDKWYA